MIVILHNRFDKDSRELVDSVKSRKDVVILDWYDEDARRAWIDAGGTDQVSGPSASFVTPSHRPNPEDLTFPAGLHVVRLVEQIAEASTQGDYEAALAASDAFIVATTIAAAATWVEMLHEDGGVDDAITHRELLAAVAAYPDTAERLAPIQAAVASTEPAPAAGVQWDGLVYEPPVVGTVAPTEVTGSHTPTEEVKRAR